MTRLLWTINQRLAPRPPVQIFALAASGVLIVGWFDYLTGYEASFSLLYVGPVAVAAWYAGRYAGVLIAVLSCLSWYVADFAAGRQYTHSSIEIWNEFIRFLFLAIVGWLLDLIHRSLARQKRLALTDGLTGLFNRRAFEDQLRHEVAVAGRRKSALTLAYVDVDDFKRVNDLHGHAGGDLVLQALGEALKGSLRESDTVARLGGDEFALVLPDTDDRGARQLIAKLAHKLQESVCARFWKVSCSIGVVTFLGPAFPPEQALSAADRLMYEVKQQGKGAIAFRVFGPAAPLETE